MIPQISVSEDFDTGLFTLMATSFLRTEPAGERLFRGGDLPAIKFIHADESEANRDRDLLQAYIDAAWSGKAPKSRGREEKEEVEPDLTGAWWK